MITSRQMSFLSEIREGKKLTLRALVYFRERLRNRLYSVVAKEFLRQAETKNLTKAEIARRIGRKPEQITRWLAVPTNWTLDTVSDLMLAMGAELDELSLSSLDHAHAEPAVPIRQPEYLIGRGSNNEYQWGVQDAGASALAPRINPPIDARGFMKKDGIGQAAY